MTLCADPLPLQWVQAKVLATVPQQQRVVLLKAQGSEVFALLAASMTTLASACGHRPQGDN